MRNRGATTITIIVMFCAGLDGSAWAADYPSKPITIVVPFAAGGPTDRVAHLVSERMAAELNQTVAIQNVAGAGGALGTGRVATSPADGYTLLLHNIGMSTAPSLYKSLPFDPVKDFEPIGLITPVPMTIVSRADLAASTLVELIAYIKAKRENVTLAHAGIGSASHLCGMLLMHALDTSMTTVSYPGAGPALSEVMAGKIDLICDQTTNTANPIKVGAIKAFAITARQRIASLPDIPTTEEAGLAEFQIAIWHGLYAPAGTDKVIVARLAEALQAALSNDGLIARFSELGTVPVVREDASPPALAALLSAQIDIWQPIIRKAGVFAD